MKKFLVMLLSGLMLTLPGMSVQAAAVKVKSGTVVPLIVNAPQSSRNITAGQQIDAVIQRDVKVGDTIVFKQGDRAKINVASVKKAGFVGIAGEMVLSGGEVYDVNNQPHRFSYYQAYNGNEKTWPKVTMGIGIFL